MVETEQFREWVALCSYPGYTLEVFKDGRGSIYLQGTYWEQTWGGAVPSIQHTRRWLLSPHMTKSEVIQTAFKCIITSMEHRVREWFRYRDRAIFGPHFDVDALHEIVERKDKRCPQ